LRFLSLPLWILNCVFFQKSSWNIWGYIYFTFLRNSTQRNWTLAQITGLNTKECSTHHIWVMQSRVLTVSNSPVLPAATQNISPVI
jgi:hypothetical protein